MSLLTLVAAAKLLARELDHELCLVVDSCPDVRLAWFFTDPNGNEWWSPPFVPLEPHSARRRRLYNELLDRVRPGGPWRLLRLSDDPSEPPVEVDPAWLIGLSSECVAFERRSPGHPERSLELRIGERSYRVLIDTEPKPEPEPAIEREVEVEREAEIEAEEEIEHTIALKDKTAAKPKRRPSARISRPYGKVKGRMKQARLNGVDWAEWTEEEMRECFHWETSTNRKLVRRARRELLAEDEGGSDPSTSGLKCT